MTLHSHFEVRVAYMRSNVQVARQTSIVVSSIPHRSRHYIPVQVEQLFFYRCKNEIIMARWKNTHFGTSRIHFSYNTNIVQLRQVFCWTKILYSFLSYTVFCVYCVCVRAYFRCMSTKFVHEKDLCKMGAAIAHNRPKTHSCDYFRAKFGLF